MAKSIRSSQARGKTMPFLSKAQQRFLEAHPEKVGGREKLKEWEQATDFQHLPEKKGLLHRALQRIQTR
jgi:hypothetical protein